MAKDAPQNAASPQYLEFSVYAGGYVTDLTTVLSAVLEVTKPDATTTTWSVTFASQTAALLVLRHVFGGADVTAVGDYKIRPLITTAAGTYPVESDTLTVYDP